jgi:hypothetical protein
MGLVLVFSLLSAKAKEKVMVMDNATCVLRAWGFGLRGGLFFSFSVTTVTTHYFRFASDFGWVGVTHVHVQVRRTEKLGDWKGGFAMPTGIRHTRVGATEHFPRGPRDLDFLLRFPDDNGMVVSYLLLSDRGRREERRKRSIQIDCPSLSDS